MKNKYVSIRGVLEFWCGKHKHQARYHHIIIASVDLRHELIRAQGFDQLEDVWVCEWWGGAHSEEICQVSFANGMTGEGRGLMVYLAHGGQRSKMTLPRNLQCNCNVAYNVIFMDWIK